MKREEERSGRNGGRKEMELDPLPLPPGRSCRSSSTSELPLGPPVDDQGISEKQWSCQCQSSQKIMTVPSTWA